MWQRRMLNLHLLHDAGKLPLNDLVRVDLKFKAILSRRIKLDVPAARQNDKFSRDKGKIPSSESRQL